jgi:predicted RecB family nuclease
VAPATSTFRLKDFGKSLGASWRELADAAESMVLYDQYQKTKDAAILQKIIDYNEDDVKAIIVVKDWLIST